MAKYSEEFFVQKRVRFFWMNKPCHIHGQVNFDDDDGGDDKSVDFISNFYTNVFRNAIKCNAFLMNYVRLKNHVRILNCREAEK